MLILIKDVLDKWKLHGNSLIKAFCIAGNIGGANMGVMLRVKLGVVKKGVLFGYFWY